MSQQFLFKNFELLEPSFGELRGGYQLLVEGDTVRELSSAPIKAPDASVIDCGGRTLMPGLIDSHVHAIHSEVNIRAMEALPLTLITARAATRLRAMLDRGFTTVRDTGGADWGIKTAIEHGAQSRRGARGNQGQRHRLHEANIDLAVDRMHVAVDQPRHQRALAAVDHRGFGRPNWRLAEFLDGGALDQELISATQLAERGFEQFEILEQELLGHRRTQAVCDLSSDGI